MKKVEIYTDGACSGNPGPGGWAAVLTYNAHKKEISGFDKDTTNNRMELQAVISALRELKEPCEVTVLSDSGYIIDSINKGWIKDWETNFWRKSDNKPVVNKDLWVDLLKLLAVHKVCFRKVLGHSNIELNERCDVLAKNKIKEHM